MTKFIGWMLAAILVAMAMPASAQTVRYIHTDALGTPVAKTDANRNVIERNEYEPFGAQLAGPNDDGPGYTGHVQDAVTGLTYMQQRYYDPTIGRFLSVDPVTADGNGGGNFNRYWYANNNPYRFTDPDGRLACGGGNDSCQEQLREFEKRGIPTWQAGDGGKAKDRTPEESDYYAERAKMGERAEQTFKEAGIHAAKEAGWMLPIGRLFGGLGRLFRIGSHADDGPRSASGLVKWSEAQGFKRTQTAGGPIKYVDGNGVVRVTIKQGSSRAPGSGAPHVEWRNASGQRVDAGGNPVTRRSPENHTPIDWDLD